MFTFFKAHSSGDIRQYWLTGRRKTLAHGANLSRIWSHWTIGTAIPLLTACGIGAQAQFGSSESLERRSQEVPKENSESVAPGRPLATLTGCG